MIEYLLKSGLLLLLFYAGYKFWLTNEKIFRFNRAYLLLSLVFSILIPLQIISFQSAASNKIESFSLDELVIQKSNENLKTVIDYLNLTNVIFGIYFLVVSILIIRFILNLYAFYRKIQVNETQFINGEKIILIEESTLPYSFWNTIFINRTAFKSNKIPSELIVHEKAHLQQKHTLDILFIEILQIVFWFNPIFVLYKKAIKLNHEFLADKAVNIRYNSVSDYQNLLLEIASDKTSINLASTINYLITKKRFLMMTKKESKIKSSLKAFAAVVFSGFLLFVFSNKSAAQENNEKLKDDSQAIAVDPIETQPEFPGGIEAFYKFIGENFKMPSEAAKNNVSGKLYLQFVVEKEGSLSEIKVLKDLGYGLGSEAIRVLKFSPKWTPGSIKEKPVRVLYSLPITIKAEK
ncbi:energy transducer TonB [Flavobacterium pectinovorum]|uniref:M56 family metallopeptidase n=1 Tax=Flavobacterium pectinovorum TaxID=29533 RepID=UPI001FABE0CE|nr:energy transducer TonB [Flavobacterium pectinovorum]MCI9845182.1 energy transducer TonB [Flavobacterium pectinovorum]